MSSGVLDRMTDTSKYTGTHKHRFDDGGKGKGLEGRDSPAKGRGMAAGCVASQTAYVPGYKHEGTYSSSPKFSPKLSPKLSPKSSPKSSPKPKAKVGDKASSFAIVLAILLDVACLQPGYALMF